MYFAEHKFLGDTTKVKSDEGTETTTHLKLDNGLIVTYGDVNGFAGDYFGQKKPISSDKDLDSMKATFEHWFDLLASSPDGKPKAEAIRAELKPLNDQAEAVLHAGGTAEELASVYKKSPLDIWKLNDVSKRWPNGACFNDLLKSNADHFGHEARVVYDAGHALALDYAAKGDLNRALAINAFADHFLEDSFAAGHLRVPRAQIMEVSRTWSMLSAVVNASANVMHEEDGEYGLWVQSPSGEKWKSFGDGRLPGRDSSGRATSTNLAQCRKSLTQSVREILDASRSGRTIPQAEFAAWHHAPIIEAIDADPDNHPPLIKIQENRIFYRDGGTYKEIKEFWDWFAFYTANIRWIDGQIKLVLRKLGIPI